MIDPRQMPGMGSFGPIGPVPPSPFSDDRLDAPLQESGGFNGTFPETPGFKVGICSAKLEETDTSWKVRLQVHFVAQ